MSSLPKPMYYEQDKTFTTLSSRTRSRSDDDTDQLSNAAKRQKTTISDTIPAARFRAEDYTVSWICALAIEMAAAQAMLDSIHGGLPKAPNDINAYILGNIGSHNVVIACLPAGHYGTNNAATVASNIERSFPSIRIHLMVGIGGGAPGKRDLRLGDIVVGSRVTQYDLGKIVGNGQIERTDSSRIPPFELLTYATKLRANHESTPTRVPSILQEMHNKYPAMTEYAHPSSQDRLFRANYDHNPAAVSCDECDASMLMHRLPRTNFYPKIHYEAIASSNQVMKNGLIRDRIAQDLQVACFEMEAAGLMNFPYLAIRGICDYSDSHKNKHWQKYAAAVAAAYAKEFLDAIPIPGSKTAAVQDVECRVDTGSLQDSRGKFLSSLKYKDIYSRQENIKAAYTRTCKWLLKNPEYLAWIDSKNISEHHGFLWINGKPGAGKSTIMKFAYTRMKIMLHANDAAISFFFHARGEHLEKSTTGMYRSLLLQLLQRFPDLQQICDGSTLVLNNDGCLTLDVIQALFRNAISMLGQRSLTCFIDALDECDELQVRNMVEYFEELGQQAVKDEIELRICFSSRHYPYIFIRHGLRLTLEDQNGHKDDVEKYVRGSLRADPGPLNEDIQAQIFQKAAGVFMWVVLVVDILNKEFSRGRMFAVKKRLAEIPDRLSDLFKDILRRDNENMADLLLCLQWILYAKRPLKRDEFYFAVSAGLLEGEDPTECLNASITSQIIDRFVISSSKGLAEVTKSKHQTVQFIHESVRDFLIKDNGLQELWPNLSCNFESLSHEKLKQCCYIYLQLDFSICVSANKPLPKKNSDIDTLRESASEIFPFFQYATQHVLYHANLAASSIPQDDFLAEFMFADWIRFNNLFEIYNIRRYTSEASRFYIFADKGLSALFKTKLCHDSHTFLLGERYRYPLFAALINGHDDIVQALMGQDVYSTGEEDVTAGLDCIKNIPIYNGQTPLLWAILHSHEPVVQLFVKQGADVSLRDKDITKPFFIALEKDHSTIAELLAEKGADTNVVNNRGKTVLWAASRYGRKPVVNLLIKKGADINARDYNGETALWAASRYGHKDIAKLLIEKGVDINAQDYDGETALWAASRYGYKDIAKLLIEKGVDMNAQDRNGETALWAAFMYGHKDIAKLLIEKGADINTKNQKGETVLWVASINEHKDVIELLIEKGADINTKDQNGITALWFASRHGCKDVIELLIEKGADINTKNQNSETALWVASRHGHKDVIELLIEKGADINTKDQNGITALWFAFRSWYGGIAELLIEKGADIFVKDNDGQTALHLATICGHKNMVKLLINMGIDINAKENNGKTALHAASTSIVQHKDVAELLIEKGADITVKDNDGQTALHLATTREHKDIVELLRRRMRTSLAFERL